MPLIGPRQNYTFRGGTTYLIWPPTSQGSAIDLYGSTTIEGGTVIKLYFGTPVEIGVYHNLSGFAHTGLIMHGSLNCQTALYRPATLTSIDDDSQGEFIYVFDANGNPIPQLCSSGNPETAPLDTVYLNLDDAHSENSISITNLRFFYADQAVTTPTNTGVLQVWDSQFYACNSGVNSRLPGGCSTNQLHNVLFAKCNFAVAAQNACAEVDAEQITADVLSFCDPEFIPSRLCMTNCIIWGDIGDGAVIATTNVANPSACPFQSANDGNYYLPAGSPYRSNGTVNVSPGMLVDLAHKTTYAPISFPTNMTISGQLTLFPQAARYTGGSPDLGYYYDPLDYTVADMVVQGGTITVLRGTAIGFRNDFVAGFNMADNSLFTSQGTPTQPVTFTDNTLVQEGPFAPGEVYNQYLSPYLGFTYYGGPAFFVPNPNKNDTQDAAPELDFRFCNFYMTQDDFGVAAGSSLGEYGGFGFSYASSVVWNMQDCSVCGGQLVLGNQTGSTGNPPGSVSWVNNLFDHTFILLQPSYGNESTPCVDLPFQAFNNLFKEGVLALDPITTTQGYWQLQNNLFDMEGFSQTSQSLDYDYNGWWTNFGSYNPLVGPVSGQLSSTTTSDGTTNGLNDQYLTNPPSYQAGPFGNYYMAQNTLLATNGSTTADQLGLYHYTTATNQAAQSNSVVDIGLHYLAASYSTNGWVPLDTDGDGIPDYVENWHGDGNYSIHTDSETDWRNPMTDGVNYDPHNAIYLNIDLVGDGLTGAMNQWLGTSPLLADNPFNLAVLLPSNTLSGVVDIPFALGPVANTNLIIILTVNGVEANTSVDQTNGVAEWDTTLVSNGVYEVAIELGSGDDPDGVTTIASSKIAYVQNAICFPNFLPLAGSTLFIQPQTIFTNGTWTMDIYDDESNLFESLNGQVDANGFCDDPVTSQPGISVSILDDQNNPLPSTYYTLAFTVTGPAGGSGGSSGGGNGGFGAEATKQIWVETGWGLGSWIVECQSAQISYPGALADMMHSVTEKIEGSGFYQENSLPILGTTEQVNGITSPLFLDNPTEWADFIGWLQDTRARNLFYFGHYIEKTMEIGGGADGDITNLTSILHNYHVSQGYTFAHPYGFVFMDGCNTGNGNLCESFGIPKSTKSVATMNAAGLNPRAFVGWNNLQWDAFAGSMDSQHALYIQEFFNLWPRIDPDTGQPYTLRACFENGKPSIISKLLMLYNITLLS